MTGEDELYVVNQDGSGAPEQLTDNAAEMRYLPVWSPDGKHIAFSDKNGHLYVIEVASKKITEVADEKNNFVRDYTWSPNGGYLAILAQRRDRLSLDLHLGREGQASCAASPAPSSTSSSRCGVPKGDYLYYF